MPYRVFAVGMLALLAGLTAIALPWLLEADRTTGMGEVVLTVLISAFLGGWVFRSDDQTTIDYINAVPFALTLSGRPGLAILSIAIANLTTPIRKPIVLHLGAYNFIGASGVTAIAACAFVAAGGCAHPVGSGTWFLASAAMAAAFIAAEFVVFQPIMVLGGYASLREVIAAQISTIRLNLLSLVPLSMLIAFAIDYGPLYSFGFLLTAFLMTYETFLRSDKLVDAERDAHTDPLTRLLNRRGLVREAERLPAPAAAGPSTWLLMADLDFFKRLNDTYGHDIGDEALVLTARTLQAIIRTDDVSARVGGEEFVAVFPDTEEHEALAIAERLRRGVKDALEAWGSTASIGLHRIGAAETLDEALKQADLAMYYSKTHGKDQVTLSHRVPDAPSTDDADAVAA